MKRTTVISLFMLLAATYLSAVTVSYDFNNTSDLNNYFNNPDIANIINVADNGINGTGSVDLPSLGMGDTRIITHKTGFHIGAIDEPITIGAYIYSAANGGYASVGFSSAATNVSGNKCHIQNFFMTTHT